MDQAMMMITKVLNNGDYIGLYFIMSKSSPNLSKLFCFLFCSLTHFACLMSPAARLPGGRGGMTYICLPLCRMCILHARWSRRQYTTGGFMKKVPSSTCVH